jgi:hypothetical protein
MVPGYVCHGHGSRLRLRGKYGSEAFWREYRAALEGALPAEPQAKPQALGWALDRYRTSSAWAALALATRRQRENIYWAELMARSPSAFTQSDLTKALKAVAAARVAVRSVEVEGNGKIVIVMAGSEPTDTEPKPSSADEIVL